jgi:hypothetical protein
VISYWKSSIKSLSDSQLFSLAKDVESRIGSHVAGGNAIDAYVQKQQALLELIQDELLRR